MDLNKLKEFVKISHKGQIRKYGDPYYLHPFAVAKILEDKGYDIEYQVAGLFHDLLEDTKVTYEDILELSNKNIADVVRLVTKEKDFEMNDYINRIKENEMAKAVKLADRIHNLRELHFANHDFIKRYIADTKNWYSQLAKYTIFENDFLEALTNVEIFFDKLGE